MNLDRYIRYGYLQQDDNEQLYLDWRTRAEVDQKALIDLLLRSEEEMAAAKTGKASEDKEEDEEEERRKQMISMTRTVIVSIMYSSNLKLLKYNILQPSRGTRHADSSRFFCKLMLAQSEEKLANDCKVWRTLNRLVPDLCWVTK